MSPVQAKWAARRRRLAELRYIKASRMGWVWWSGKKYRVYADLDLANYPW